MIQATAKRIKSLHLAMINYLISLFGCFKAEEVDGFKSEDVEPPVVFKETASENDSDDWGSEIEIQTSDLDDWDVVK